MKGRCIILTVLTVAFFLAVGLHGFSMYVGNYSEEGFKEDNPVVSTDSKSGITSSISLRYLIIKSAAYFLKGRSNIDLLASRLEAADIEAVSFYELQKIVSDALYNMRTARYYYEALRIKAANTPYNQTVTEQLADFDYDTFCKGTIVNGDMFSQVRGYLEGGDVRGTYARLYVYTDSIIGMLETVQNEVNKWDFPETAMMWRLNQECAHMLLFGQYIAQIFQQLR
jgi:hypothetical protein